MLQSFVIQLLTGSNKILTHSYLQEVVGVKRSCKIATLNNTITSRNYFHTYTEVKNIFA